MANLNYVVQDSEKIYGFFGDYRFLSNFHLTEIHYQGLIYPSTEHAYQAAKYSSVKERMECLNMTPNEARKWGQFAELPANWNEERLIVMYEINSLKFLDSRLNRWLLSTNGKRLFEANHWGDHFWGVDGKTGLGKNNLGRILEIVRWRMTNRHEYCERSTW